MIEATTQNYSLTSMITFNQSNPSPSVGMRICGSSHYGCQTIWMWYTLSSERTHAAKAINILSRTVDVRWCWEQSDFMELAEDAFMMVAIIEELKYGRITAELKYWRSISYPVYIDPGVALLYICPYYS